MIYGRHQAPQHDVAAVAVAARGILGVSLVSAQPISRIPGFETFYET